MLRQHDKIVTRITVKLVLLNDNIIIKNINLTKICNKTIHKEKLFFCLIKSGLTYVRILRHTFLNFKSYFPSYKS